MVVASGQVSGDMSEDITESLAAAEIVTQSYAVTGLCRGLNEHIRLIDILNIPEVTHLQLSNVKVRELTGAREAIPTDGPVLIDKRFVVFGRSLESPEVEAKRKEAHWVDQVEKVRHLVLVSAPPFRILGNIHIIKDADLSVALPKLFESFMAMTEIRAAHESESESVWESGLIIVNGRRIEMACPVSPDYWRPHVAAAEPAEKVEEQDIQKTSASPD